MSNSHPTNSPPKWSISFLEWFCPDELLEGIMGDLIEEFEADHSTYSNQKASRRFIWNVIRMFHPYIVFKNRFSKNFITMGMFISHLKIALRSMKKHSFYSVVNLLGLSMAIAFIFLSFQFIQTTLEYDNFHTNKENIYRLYHEITDSKTGLTKAASAVTAIPLSKDLSMDVADIQEFTRECSGTTILTMNGKPSEEKIHYVDPGFLKMFDFPMTQGNDQALNLPNSIIISTEKAIQLLGNKNAMGQVVSIKINDTNEELKITGIIDSKKEKSSIQFDFLAPIDLFKKLVGEETFNSYNYGLVENYILTNGTHSPEDLASILTQAVQKYSADDNDKTKIGVQALSSIHLEDQIIGNTKFTSPKKLYVMTALALMVIIIAVINFVTLSTSHALNRAKEMGLRSTLGAVKKQLKRQMISESFFMTLLSCLLGIGLATSFLPVFAQLIESKIAFSFGLKELIFVSILSITIAWMNGSLQALFLIKNNAIQSLNGNLKVSGKNSVFNQSLLVVQFSLSIMLIIGAWGIRMQMQYIQNKDLGYNEERLIEINMNSSPDVESAKQLVERFKALALQNQQITAVSATMNNAQEPWTQLMFEQTDGQPEGIFYNQVDPSYLNAMNIELVEGENFRMDQPNTKRAILVNESLVKHFGWEQPFDQHIPGKKFTESPQIIGVVKDFHFSSLHQKIEPLILALDLESVGSGITGLSTYVWPANLYQLLVRVGPGKLPPVIQYLEETWKAVAPENAFVYHFVDEVLEAKYAEEQRWSKVMNIASIFAIFIAWLGLLGLMRLSVQKRMKEIGIRKVLGASTSGIISLLSKQYLLLIVIGNIIAFPLAWWLMQQWLNSFSYRIELNPALFITAGIFVLLFTLSSLILQSLKAASANPVNTIRIE